MRLDQRDKELAAIGASIGANCRPCAEHHVPAGRDAGLSETELVGAVATAGTVREQAAALFSARVEELLGRVGASFEPTGLDGVSRDHEFVALGASVGANSHPLLHLHIGAALDVGLTPGQVEAALKMAEYVQRRAAEMTADEATHALDERAERPVSERRFAEGTISADEYRERREVIADGVGQANGDHRHEPAPTAGEGRT